MLNRSGIRVIRLWEHDLEHQTMRCRCVLDRIESLLLTV
jgi:hypothetical protein